MQDYLTIADPLIHETERVKGSRFIAAASPVANEREAQTFVTSRRSALPDASHHCYAWRLGEHQERFSDDGEPTNSAGQPILRPIQGLELLYTCVIVSRYFGGTKLGIGGLMRAYGSASRQILERAEIVKWVAMATLSIQHDYALNGPLEGLMRASSAKLIGQEFGARVVTTLQIPESEAPALEESLRNLTNGRAKIERNNQGD